MGEYKKMSTPMELKLKLPCDASVETLDTTMYRQMIGSLMYLKNMRPDICFAVNTLIQFLTNLRHVQLIATNHILRYLKGIVEYWIKYEANQNINLEGYVDSDWERNAIDRKSNLGCYFKYGIRCNFLF